MPTWVVSPSEMSSILAAHAKAMPEAMQRGVLKSAHRAKADLVRHSPTDRGHFKNSWKITGEHSAAGAQLTNDSPIAGVIELGARPHPVSRAGIDALTGWVKRHMLLNKQRAVRRVGRNTRAMVQAEVDKEARGVAFAIARKIAKFGQKGTFLVHNRMPKFSKWLAQEVHREVAKALTKKFGGP